MHTRTKFNLNPFEYVLFDESFGIVYCHGLKDFEANEVKIVPNQYILKMWIEYEHNDIAFDVRKNEFV